MNTKFGNHKYHNVNSNIRLNEIMLTLVYNPEGFYQVISRNMYGNVPRKK